MIPKLTKFLYEQCLQDGGNPPSFLALVQMVLLQLEGAYALIFKSRHFPARGPPARRARGGAPRPPRALGCAPRFP